MSDLHTDMDQGMLGREVGSALLNSADFYAEMLMREADFKS